MSQVTNPIILNSTGQDIALALAGLATAIANKPDPATQTPVMDGVGGVGSSLKYAREDHQHPSDDTKANRAQLAYVETGTTASRTYAVGEYFCWNGLLYRAKTAISSGGTFTPGTNCEQVPSGGLNSVFIYASGESYSFTGVFAGISNVNGTLVSMTIQVPKYIPANATITKNITINWVRGQGTSISASVSNLTRASSNCLILDLAVSGVLGQRSYYAYLDGTITFG